MTITLLQGDCLEIMPTLTERVDAIITDLPYGTTACSWDTVIPFAPMWAAVKRVLKPRGVFVTTASQPFTSLLICSNLDWFKYEWIWKKQPVGFLNAKKMPLKSIENVCVFYNDLPTYNPQWLKRINIKRNNGTSKTIRSERGLSTHNGGRLAGSFTQEFENYPDQLIEFSKTFEGDHPTQKPVALYSYLIQTYTNPGDTVLDICMGSGTTLVAAIQTGRNAIGIELDPGYFAIAQKRIADAQQQMRLPMEA